MKILTAFLMVFAVMASSPISAAGADTPRGRLTGGVQYELPGWFKKSFLVMNEDLEEANRQGRHLALFFHLDECPYCARLLDENFRRGDTKDFTEKHFDIIGINIRGGNTVEWFDGHSYSETELARKLKVVATPTMIFLDAKGNIALQLNGYRAPAAVRQALEYVHGKHYSSQSLADFVEKRSKAAAYRFRQDARFSQMADFKGYRKPLAVFFEVHRLR